MITVDIPGGHAQIRELNEVSVRHRNMVRASFMVVAHLYKKIPQDVLDSTSKTGQEGLEAREKVDAMMMITAMTQNEAEALLAQQSAAIVAFLGDWDLTDETGAKKPLPTMDTVLDLSPDLYDALAKEVAAPTSKMLLGSVNMDPVPREVDPNAPFDESVISDGLSKTPVTKKPKSTGKQASATENIATASSLA